MMLRPLILMYHSVSEEGYDDPYTVTPKALEAQIDWLIQNKFEFISLQQVVTLIFQRKFFFRKRYVTLTFDDGYADFLSNAMPILRKHGIPSTLFLVTGKLGCTDEWSQSAVRRRLLNVDELKEIKAIGDVTLGSHTVHHVDLTMLDHQSLQNELISSRELLTDLGETFYPFSYPWGRYTQREKNAVKAAGYDCAVSTEGYHRTGKKDMFSLGRLTITDNVDFKQFENIYL